MSDEAFLAIGIFMLVISGIGAWNLYNKVPVETFRRNPIVALTGDVLGIASGTCFICAVILLCKLISLFVF